MIDMVGASLQAVGLDFRLDLCHVAGKIMRRILRKIAENELGSLGDTSTLADPSVVDDLIASRVND